MLIPDLGSIRLPRWVMRIWELGFLASLALLVAWLIFVVFFLLYVLIGGLVIFLF